MQKLYLSPTDVSPEICFSPLEGIFYMRGISAPEDVRELYYPVLEWFRKYIDILQYGNSEQNRVYPPMRLQIDLTYFNSSSAKFLFDIFLEAKRLVPLNIPFAVEWCYDEEDTDMQEAGYDIARLVEMEFVYVPKRR